MDKKVSRLCKELFCASSGLLIRLRSSHTRGKLTLWMFKGQLLGWHIKVSDLFGDKVPPLVAATVSPEAVHKGRFQAGWVQGRQVRLHV